MRKFIGLMSAILAIGMVSLSVQAGALFWDTSTAAGYQGGDGRWTVHPADTNWSSDGLVRKPFVNNEDGMFLNNDGPSVITMDGGVFSNNSSSVRGANYTIIMTNGAQLTCTYAGGADFFLGYGTNWGSSASNTWIVAAGTPTAPTMLKTSRTGGYTMYIGGGNGNGSYSNVLIVDGGGVLGSAMVTNSGATMVGAIGAVACGIDVRREGLFYAVNGGIQVGVVGSTNCFIRSDGAEIRTTALSLYGDFSSANFLNGSRYYDSGAAGLIVGGGGWATNCSLVIDNSQVTHGGYGDFKISGNNSWGVITNGGYLNLAGGNYRYIGETASNCSLRVVGGGPNTSLLTLGANVLTVGLLGGKSNEVWVDGQGVAGSAVMTNGFVTVGSGAAASGNRLVITNSGRYFMSAGAGTIGSSASANRADVVGGPGVESVWNGGNQAMTIGNLSSSFNLLVIDGKGELGSAVMTNIGSLAIGFNGSQASPSTMNAVIVTNGGALYLGAGANFGHGALAHGIGVIGGNVYAATSNRLEIVQGGRVYSSAALFIGFNYYNGPLIGNRLIVRDSDSLLDMRGYGIEAPHSYPQNAICISGVELLIDAGVVTNVAGLILPNRLAGNLLHDNRLIVTNGGKFYMTAAGSIGTTGGSNNVAVISGSNSLWTLGGAALTVGAAGYSNNVLIIDQGGTVDNVGTLTLAGGFNFINLRGGTLGAATTTYTNGLFTVGDGAQAATLKSLVGGTLAFNNGLLITNSATLAGVGTVGGGSVGVILTNGATLSPGINGPGSLTIGGSNLNWAGGGVYQCEVTDLNLGFGVGWDVLNVSSQLVFAGTSPKFVLKIDSKGSAAAGFNPALNYTLKILAYGNMTGYDTNLITLDTSAFSTVPASTWYLTNFNNSVYLAYDGTSPLGDANLVWKVPSNGNWNVAGNWAGGVAPDAGGNPANVLNFGDNGTRYFSTNNLTGTFQLNKLVLASISTVTNLICGSNLAFTVNGATAPRLEFQTGGGTFVISNALSLDTGMVFGGDGGGTLVLASNVAGGQPLVKQGPWTLALAGSNVFADPVVVTNVSVIRLDNINAIGSSSLIVSNGGKLVNTAGYTFGNSSYRSALVTGNDSYWTNGSLTVGTNAQVTIDGGRLAINGALTVADRGTVANSLTVTNGGRIAITGEFVVGTGNIDNSALIAAGGQIYSLGNTRVGNNAGGHRNSLVVRGTDALLDGGARNLYVGYHASASLYSNSMTIADNAVVANCMLSVGGGSYNSYNSLVVTNGGKLFTKAAITYIGSTGSSNSVAVIGGSSASLWDNGGQQLTVGAANNSSNNSLTIDGAGAGAVVTNVGLFQVGGSGAGMGNRLIVTNGGVLVYGSPGLDNNGVGYSSSNNTFAIAMGGKVYARGASTYVGEYAPASSNLMSVRDPGSLFDAGGGKITVGAYNNSAMGNLLLIDNSGVVSNCAVNVGSDFGGTAYYSTWNLLVITNGGKLSGVSGVNNTIGGAVGGSFNSATLYSNSTWNVAGGSLIVGQGTNNSLNLQDGGLVTNAASVYVGYNSPGARFNSLIITNGGKLYSTAVSGIGHAYLTAPAFGQSSNSVVVSGPNSLWSLGGANLTIGYTAAGSATGNVLTIDQGGTVDNIGTLTVNINSNGVNLYGGTLGLTSAIYSNGMIFTAGDGTQGATLKALGGTVSFPSGLLINTNATLTGIGTVNGGPLGVTLTNGATIKPGLAGAGTLTLGGSNLTWNAGATVLVEIGNMAGGAGSGYGTMTVSTQLALVADVGSSSLVIRLSTRGVEAANFSTNASYNLLIASVTSLTDFDASKFTVNTDDFLNPVAGTWGVMRLDNNLYVTYRPTVETGTDYTWTAPSNGNWKVDGNWVGGVAPPASSPGMRLTFGGAANDPLYIANNDNVGAFQLNRLVLTNANAAMTNILTGNPLQFWSAEAAIEQGGSGSFNIDFPLSATTNLVLRGMGSGMVLLTNTTVAGSLTKEGASTAVLRGTNSFVGPLVVNGAGGTLRIDNLNALSTNSIRVSDGTLSIPSVMTTFGNIDSYRSAQVTGSGATWTNGSALTIGINAQVMVDAGGRLAINGALTVADRGTVANSLTVTNGGQIYGAAASIVGNGTSNNSASVVGGGALWHAGNTAVTIGSGAGATNNTILVDGLGVECGARMTNVATMTVGSGAGSGWNTLLLTQGGQLYCTAPTIGNASSNNTVVISGGGSLWSGGAGALSIGLAAGGVSNLLRIDGLGARMTNMGNVTLGSAVGSGWNTLIVTNGGQLSSLGAIAIGSTSSNNAVVISGGGALWNNLGALTIGSGAGMTNNTLLIDGQNMDGGAMMTNVNNIVIGSIGDYNAMRVNNMGRIYLAGSFSIGNGNGSRSNQLIVEQGGKMKGTALANSYVGLAGGYANLLVIRDAGSVFDLGTGASYVFIGGSTTLSTGTGNVMRVENGGVFTNGHIRIGASDATHFDVGNLLVVTNGLVYASGGASVVGYGFNSCFATALVVGASSVWNGGAQAINVGWGALAMSNTLWIDAALVTNVAGFNLGQALAQTNSWNQMVITNGAQVYANGATVIGASTYGTNNTAIVTGPGTVWNQGGANLTLGGARTASNNTLRIDQGASVDTIGTLTINSNNVLHLRGGTLGVTATTFTNGTLFTIGDGVQDATLKALGGTLAFNSGLLLTNKNTLTGLGTISGGAVGVVLTNGATLDPGISGAGSLVIGGSNLTWKGGAVYNVDITNLNLGAGNGWDLVTVNTQLLFTAGAPNYVIRMDSKGSQPVGFEPNRDYNIRIMTVNGAITGYDPSIITVNTNAFVGGTSPWVVSNVANTLYLVYRGATPGSAASDIWSVPNNGNWDVNENWVGGTAPGAGGDSTTILGFGDNGTRYNSTNNLGAFRLNQMQVSSASLVTNLITGNPLIFTNNGANLPRMDFLTGAGAFTISNALILSTDTVFGGNAFVGGTVTLGGAITNQGTLTKQGTWTLVLSNANNNLTGPVMVDSPDGVLRVDQVNALNGSGPVTVSNGLLWVKWPSAGFYFANAKDNRRGWVTSGAVWSNVCAGENNQSGFALGSSNVQITIDGGKMYWTVRFGAFASGSSYGTVLVTNGGQLNLSAPTYGTYVGSGSTNCTMTITGPNTLFNQGGGSGGLTVSEGSGSGNILRVDNGALATNITTITVGGVNGNNENSLIVTNGGRLFNSGFTVAKTASANNRFIVTGSNSYWQQLVAANQMAIGTASGTNNLFLLNDGAIATNIRLSAFANTGSNLITIANGGKLFLTTGYTDAGTLAVGPFANGNLTTVTGSGSVWNGMGMILTLAGGNTCSWNRLSVESGGLITNFATVNVASGLNSLNNSLVVDGGILQATTLAFNNLLPNDFTLTGGGRVTLTSFALSNSNQRLNLNGGEFRVQSALVTNWGSFTVGDGSQTAVLSLLPGITTNRFYDGLVITNQATLTGQGTIQATTTVFGVLSPGMTLGSLTNIGGLTLKTSSESRFEIMTNSTPGVGWDYLVVTNGTLTLGGTLKPVLTGGFVPTNTQSYVIMTNAGPLGVSGEFFNGGNNATIAAYSNDLSKVMGVFRLVISNQCVILNSFLPNSSLQRGSVFRVY